DRVLGAGGMGVVVAAHHLGLDNRVAIKFLLPEMLGAGDAVARFAREAKAAVKISNEHVARVLDVGALENGAPYMVMEYLDGSDLHQWLERHGAMPVAQAVDFLLQACEAIAEAHGLGIVHRDLKPANLFCVRRADGKLWIKVLDFGISKATSPGGGSSLALTATTSLMGSPFYMSPEQMEGARGVDARTDIWALGVIVFQLLTSKVPFYGETVPEVCSKIATRAPPRPREYRPDIPEGLQGVVLTCLEKDRERRYRNVAELALALAPFAPRRAHPSIERIGDVIRTAGLSTAASTVSASPDPVGQPPRVETMAPLGSTAAATKGGKAVAGLVACGAVLGLAAAAAVIREIVVDRSAAGSGRAVAASAAEPAAVAAMVEGTAKTLETLPTRLATTDTTLEPKPAAQAEATASPSCAPGSTRCSGGASQRCAEGQWVTGPVAAGACGAVCTPASSRPRCTGAIAQTCGPAGQWKDGATCSKPQICRDGACVDAPPPPSKPCEPPYYWDSHGNRVFKTECL
ncbi:MAG TPA: serine/threonine-protein kinase, partial [Polyangiaceae bacterium]|nr:serine/threonine-protein kinase [Polyangiaceae bacterium]